MATTGQHVESSGQAPLPGSASYVEYEAFIESQLRKTRGHVRAVDFTSSVLVLLVGSLVFVLLAALVDHWLVRGGLGFWGRLVLLVAYLLAAGWWTAAAILPLLFKRINPLYAAHTIERAKPSLKNSLVNFLLFRSAPESIPQRVLEQIEQQAATSLAGVQVESAVDRTRLIRLGYVLIGVLAVCALYALVSPKNLFQTVGRVAMPWADIAPPTSTTIDEIEPGTTQAFRGQQVTVKARVQGLPADGKVFLYYTTADRQIVDRPVEMTRPPDDYRHTAVLLDAESSLQQSLTYRIVAGDATTRDYSIRVVAAPTIVVRAVEYKYPQYTGLIGQRVEHQGDLKGIEGTEVTIEALANQPIAQAYVDFDANQTLDLPMQVDGTTAKATFKLAMAANRQGPEHSSYQLIFKNERGGQNLRPVRHQIEVTPDLPPTIEFVAPRAQEVEVPLDGSIELEVVASDPDFELAQVTLAFTKRDKPLAQQQLLKENWRGQFNMKYRFRPAEHRLAAGDVVDYWGVAVDNKSPRANKTETGRRHIRIISPEGRPGSGDQLASNANGQEVDQRDSADPRASENDRAARDGETPAEKQAQAGEEGEPGGERDKRNARDQDVGEHDDSASSDGKSSDNPRSSNSEQSADGARQSQGEKHSERGEQSKQNKSENGQESGQSGRDKSDSSKQGSSGNGRSGSEAAEQQASGEKAAKKQDGRQQGTSSGKQGKDDAAEGDAAVGDDSAGSGSDGGNSAPADSQSSSGARESVASDGSNDGDAIERILEHREQRSKDTQAREARPSNAQPSDSQPSGEKDAGDQQGDQPSAERQSDAQQGAQSGKKQPGSQAGSKGQKSSDAKPRGQDDPGADGEPSLEQAGDKQGGDQGGQPSERSENESASDDSRGDQSSGKGSAGRQGKPDASGEKSSTEPDSNGQDVETDERSSPEEVGSKSARSDARKADGEREKPNQKGESGQPGDMNDRDRGGRSQKADDASQPSGQEESDQTDPRSGATQENSSQDGAPKKSDTTGKGAQSKDEPRPSDDSKSQPSDERRPDARGGDGEQSKGNSGAGQKSNENAGSPKPQERNQPRDKSQGQENESQEQSRDSQEQSPSTSNKESDSQGDEDGDRSGGGKRGGGQKANQSGTGSAGQNTAADEGAGQSDQSGDGETSDRAGNDKQAQGETGQSGSQAGQGSKQSPSGEGQQQPGGSESGQSPAAMGQRSGGSQNGRSQGGNTPGGEQPGAEQPNGTSGSDQEFQPGADRADEANLEYTRKATDLALEHLKHELANSSDTDLLERLGWTRQEAEEFVRRWETLRRAASAPDQRGQAGRRELDDTLRSLGLRPRGAKISGNAARDDRMKGLKESHRTTPPAEYSEAFKAYTQGTSRGGK